MSKRKPDPVINAIKRSYKRHTSTWKWIGVCLLLATIMCVIGYQSGYDESERINKIAQDNEDRYDKVKDMTLGQILDHNIKYVFHNPFWTCAIIVSVCIAWIVHGFGFFFVRG